MASLVESPDRALVASFLADRGEAAFRRLYRRHTPRMLRLGRRLTAGSAASAEDVVQEAWVRAARTIHRFEWRSSVATWLAGIVVNVAREHRRAVDSPLPDVGHEQTAWRDPIETVALAGAMREMPQGFRSVVALHDLAGFTHDEIGRILGIDAGTSKSQLARGRARLRSLLEGRDVRHD